MTGVPLGVTSAIINTRLCFLVVLVTQSTLSLPVAKTGRSVVSSDRRFVGVGKRGERGKRGRRRRGGDDLITLAGRGVGGYRRFINAIRR